MKRGRVAASRKVRPFRKLVRSDLRLHTPMPSRMDGGHQLHGPLIIPTIRMTISSASFFCSSESAAYKTLTAVLIISSWRMLVNCSWASTCSGSVLDRCSPANMPFMRCDAWLPYARPRMSPGGRLRISDLERGLEEGEPPFHLSSIQFQLRPQLCPCPFNEPGPSLFHMPQPRSPRCGPYAAAAPAAAIATATKTDILTIDCMPAAIELCADQKARCLGH